MEASTIQEDTMTKSKKKRMKRLEAQKRKAKENKLGQISSLNPIDKIRVELSNLGIDVDIIHISIEEMWDKQLDYSDFDSVLAYILNRDSMQPITTINTDGSCDGAVSVNTNLIECDKSETEENSDSMETPLSNFDGSTRTNEIKRLDLSAKLTFVANLDDLGNSIRAIVQWITKAAKPLEIKDFCKQDSDSALSTIITRCILGGSGYMDILLDLFASILLTVDITAPVRASCIKKLDSLLQLTIKHTLDSDDTVENKIFATVISRLIILRIENFVNIYMRRSILISSNAVLALDTKFKEIKSMIETTSVCEVEDLSATRDECKVVSEKCFELIHLMLNDIKQHNDVKITNNRLNINDIVHDTIKECLHDESDCDESFPQMDLPNTDTKHISNRTEHVRAELKKLGMREFAINRSIDRIGITSKETKEDDSCSITGLRGRINAIMIELIAFNEGFDDLANNQSRQNSLYSYRNLDSSLVLFISSSISYLQSGGQLISLLIDRVDRVEADLALVVQELVEFDVLGMPNTVADLRNKQKDMGQTLSKNYEMLERLQTEDKEYRNKMSSRVSEVCSAVDLVEHDTKLKLEKLIELLNTDPVNWIL